MQLDEKFDADEILREKFGDSYEEETNNDDEEIEELNLGNPHRIGDLDLPDAEGEEDDYGL